MSFVREGCKKIAIADQNAQGLEETTELIRDLKDSSEVQIVSQRTNVLDENEVYELLDTVVEQLGRVDYCCNAAGMTIRKVGCNEY